MTTFDTQNISEELLTELTQVVLAHKNKKYEELHYLEINIEEIKKFNEKAKQIIETYQLKQKENEELKKQILNAKEELKKLKKM
ncbi:hypothetical protein KM1_182900 [Entamoeba histolytica HM-3:IMSS]|uniref:Uncharacterized protein n=1 Tax=Entamoeba histolytica HM-3:IMSS TaxID=885315 RepID=M7WRA1_ENTHI|nr:hypothetical protein KM1_182900 [Entamoeba histolytica HM-3:IMSS]